jgi:MFS family permease
MSDETPLRQNGVRRWFRGLAIDPTPLQTARDYRLLFLGQAVSAFGSMMTYAVFPWQMYQLTKSNALVGLIGVVEFLPMFTLAFIGGALADVVDRRKWIIFIEVAKAVLISLLVVNACLPQPRVWVLFVVTFFYAAVAALQRPAFEALQQSILSPELMAAAAALGSLRYNFAAIAGPAFGGVLAATMGAGVAYGVDVVTFLVSLATLVLMQATPPPEAGAGVTLRSIAEGMRYAWARKDLLGTYLIDLNAMFFGMPMALFPAMAEQFGNSSVGWLYAMPAVGAVVTSLVSGWTTKINKHGLAVAIAATVWGVAIIGFGLAHQLWLALLFLALAGGADNISGIFRMTMWNQSIPNHLRGRLAGIELVSYTTGPMLGNAEAGLVASLSSVRTSVVSGGVLCVLGSVVVAALLPAFIRYDGRAGLTRKRAEELARREAVGAPNE